MNFPFYNTSTDFGSEVHRALEDIIHGKAKPEDFTGDVQRALENAMLAWEDLKSKYPGLEVVDTELDVDVPLNSITDSEYPDLLWRDHRFRLSQADAVSDARECRRGRLATPKRITGCS